MSLAEKQCVSCQGGAQPLDETGIQRLLGEVPGWQLGADGKSITRRFQFKNFAESLAFVNRVGEIAEAENHHPDISFGWGFAELLLTTHDIGGLHENDFIIAARINQLA